MISKLVKRICFTTCGLLTAAGCILPATKVQARGEAGVALAAGAGALVGAAIASDMAHHKHHHKQPCQRPCCAQIQQQTMRYVLNNYNPAFHNTWVQYVVVDCSGVLTPTQQNQLLEIMNQRQAQMGCPIAQKAVETRTVYHY